MGDVSDHRVGVENLRWRCDPDRFGFESTDDVECCREIIGQDRALDAIRLGLEISSPGYNIYVSGLTGTGKSTTIQRLLRGLPKEEKQLQDICYVHNFRAPEEPVCVYLPAGQGAIFKKSMVEVVKTLREHVPKVLESDSYTERHKRIVSQAKSRRGEQGGEFEKLIEKKGFQLHEVQYGPFTRPAIVPVIDGKPVEMEELQGRVTAGQLEQAEFDRLGKDHEDLTGKMEAFLKATRDEDRDLTEKIRSLQKQFVSPIVDTCVKEVEERFPSGDVHEYLAELREYSVDNLDLFLESEEPDVQKRTRAFVEFEVNVIVENARSKEAPIIIETAPTYRNVFGTIERITADRIGERTDLTMIRAGSLLRANGGFLVMSLTEIFEEPAVWPALKRTLKNKKISIQALETTFFGPTSALKPQPIDIDVKVVLIGDAESYQVMYQYDEDFRKIFKVKADFDTEMPNNQENLNKYGQFIKNLITEEDLLPFHKSAVAACAEQGAEIAGRQDKLTTRFSDVADIAREASYWTHKAGEAMVRAEHVGKAVEERIHRVNLSEEKMSEMLVDGTILLDIDGEKIGQVNGLSVFDLGDYAFGKPVRITVETSMGRAGIINIEREAEMSGKTYNKGSLILEGYLRSRFAQSRPLAMSASICFEQSYGGVDGDSASSTEIYGLLSSLGDLPLRQDLTVTGSVNQKGEIQPIGGVNEKIHGFYDICKAKGFTGTQGVIIPKLNEVDLMLRTDVVETIKDGKFHVYSVETIDEGIELLTGVRGGAQAGDGSFEKDSVNDRVDKKLEKFAEQIRDYYESGDERE
ncbi:MAG: ATP-binding protein [Candidatus Krumholzibacteria bacterium]